MSGRRRPLGPGQIGLLVSIVGMFGPPALALAAGGIGSALGCPVNEGGTSPCLAAGIDIEPLLTMMFSLFWFVLLVPVWIVVAVVSIVQIVRERRR